MPETDEVVIRTVFVHFHENMGIMRVSPEHTQKERGAVIISARGVVVLLHVHTLSLALSLLFCEKCFFKVGIKWKRPREAYFKN